MRLTEVRVQGGDTTLAPLAREGGERRRRLGLIWVLLVAIGLMNVPTSALAEAPASAAAPVSVVVRKQPGAGDAAERLVERFGGRVGRRLGIINGFAATVPVRALARLQTADGVQAVTPNGAVRLQTFNGDFDPEKDYGSLFRTAKTVDAETAWDHGLTGRGVDVALIDSGVAPVKGLSAPGKVINGADISPDAAHPEVAYLDGYGHGTHMAGIIAGRDDEVAAGREKDDKRNFLGVAPDARIINVKVSDLSGAADVSQVIAGIDWVVQHRTSGGLNIRVLNLSFGTDGAQSYQLDPLAYAAEVAWREGIFVVVSAGNSGDGSPKLNNPATDPFVLAVGAADPMGSDKPDNDIVPAFSSRGDASRRVDLVAPGKSVVGLRVPGSVLDSEHPGGRVGQRYFRGSGTSQAAAVMSGAAALLIQQRPGISPDQLKALFTSTARPLRKAAADEQGAGIVDIDQARHENTPEAAKAAQTFPASTGTGSIELARGTAHVLDANGVPITGEQDVLGNPWDGRSWSGRSWSADVWSGRSWSGDNWSGRSWSGTAWTGRSWSADNWSGRSWSSDVWSSAQWGDDATILP
jgi:hypothetical protein